jgi:hypothetical protein
VIASGHGWGLAIFPLIAAVIALAFAGVLCQRLADRWRWHEACWAVALFMFAAASVAMFMGVVVGWSASEFRLYWLFGAVLNVPWLFAGELFLLSPKRTWAQAFLVVLAVASLVAWSTVWSATVHRVALDSSLPLGRKVFGSGTAPHRLAQYYSFPAYFALLGGLVWSVLKMKGRPELRDRAAGTFGIAMGATLVAVGSGIGAAFEVVPVFSVSLAAGIAVMFWGFLRASRRRPVEPAVPASP